VVRDQIIEETILSTEIENLLVSRNLRGMKSVQQVLQPGYYLRAARILRDCRGSVLIGTGFPVAGTFETDGPVGAIALYRALENLGSKPTIICAPPISCVLKDDYRVHEISLGTNRGCLLEASRILAHYQPDAVLAIERPGQSEDGFYYNIRGENISEYTACFDAFINGAGCPTIGIGDGGNEIGMGNISAALKDLGVIPSITKVDELLIADVSNWGAYGIIAFLSFWSGIDLLAKIKPREILKYLSVRGSVDGVTTQNELTEDGLDPDEGESILLQLRYIIGAA